MYTKIELNNSKSIPTIGKIELQLTRKEVNIIRFSNCPEYKNTSAFFKSVLIKRNKIGISVSLSFDMVYKKEVKRFLISATVWKCDFSGNPDSCEYYIKDFKINNVCDLLGKKHEFWSEMVSNSNFSTTCPIPAGSYRLNDTKLDGYMKLTFMTIPNALWRVKFFSYDGGNDNDMVYCTNFELKIYNIRKNLQ